MEPKHLRRLKCSTQRLCWWSHNCSLGKHIKSYLFNWDILLFINYISKINVERKPKPHNTLRETRLVYFKSLAIKWEITWHTPSQHQSPWKRWGWGSSHWCGPRNSSGRCVWGCHTVSAFTSSRRRASQNTEPLPTLPSMTLPKVSSSSQALMCIYELC